MLGLRFCARSLCSRGEWGPLFFAVRGPLTVAASLVAEHKLQTRRLSSCGPRAQLLRGTWDPPRPGLEPVSPALAGRFSTTAPPGKPPQTFFSDRILSARELAAHCWEWGGAFELGGSSLRSLGLGLGWKTQFSPASVLCSLGQVT